MNFDRIIEQLIRDAQAQGKFDNLPGRGKPLDLNDDPNESGEMWAANRLVKKHGFRPDWLEEDVALRERLETARQALRRSRDWRHQQLSALGSRADVDARQHQAWVADEWARAQAQFRDTLAQINKSIVTLNLKMPLERLQWRKLDVEAELQKALES
jgi:DnaJ family protein C protein 28